MSESNLSPKNNNQENENKENIVKSEASLKFN